MIELKNAFKWLCLWFDMVIAIICIIINSSIVIIVFIIVVYDYKSR